MKNKKKIERRRQRLELQKLEDRVVDVSLRQVTNDEYCSALLIYLAYCDSIFRDEHGNWTWASMRDRMAYYMAVDNLRDHLENHDELAIVGMKEWSDTLKEVSKEEYVLTRLLRKNGVRLNF